ncbi:MAG: hypothetical protein M0025_05340 [Elusimicrobia bacterium]|nr:hypothetical protein [Elusimicrobiota bacterium]
MGIEFNINFKKKIRINGKEYDSEDQVPPELRQTVHDALLNSGAPGRRKIVINGVPYENTESMPPDIRQIYDQAMKRAAEAGEPVAPHPAKLTLNADLKPEGSASWRTITIFLIAGAVLLLLKLLR